MKNLNPQHCHFSSKPSTTRLNKVKNLNPHTAEILRYAQYDRPFSFPLSVFSLSFTNKAFVDVLKELILIHLANGDIDVAVVDNAHL